MNRRQLLAATGAGALVGVGGCIDGSQESADGDATDSQDVVVENGAPPPRDEFPDRPDELDNESVLEYVGEHQRTVLVQNPYTGCEPQVAAEYEEGFYVGLEECDIITSEGDAAEVPVLYLVTETDTYRLELDVQEAVGAGFEDGGPHNLVLANFDDTEHDLSVELVHYDADGDSTVALDTTYTLGGERGVYLDAVPVSRSETDLRVELADGSEVSERLETTPNPAAEPFRAVYITPASELVIRELEFRP
ncbi:hypothetical protein OB905_06800 [Halobacteria archaeon AArc-dxtr1]|nr:hypothetical protein [Halobacteria archaeon AArc-dxtr1]